MKYIAHRGLWNEKSSQNTYTGIKRALDLGFGVELDVRDNHGELIVSHDPAHNSQNLLFHDIVELASKYDSILAVNVKSDGILKALRSALGGLDRSRYFLFDMSIPETLGYLSDGLPTFMRLSEYEVSSKLHHQSQGIWLDAFHEDWWIDQIDLFKVFKAFCIVSPELHGRNEEDAWRFLKNIDTFAELHLCTDYPEKAKDFFE